MKYKAWRLLPLAALAVCASAWAAENSVQLVYTDVVAPSQQQAYEAGVKAFNQCLAQNGVSYRFNDWHHVTGNTYEYSYVSDTVGWADLDTMHRRVLPCMSVWQTQVNPHLMSERALINELLPGMDNLSLNALPEFGLVYVQEITLKHVAKARNTFVNDMMLVYQAMEKTKWPGHSMTMAVDGGGRGSWDYYTLVPLKSFKEWGTLTNAPFWKMVAKAYGQKRADQLRDSLDSVIKSTSTHFDAYDPDMSYVPAGR